MLLWFKTIISRYVNIAWVCRPLGQIKRRGQKFHRSDAATISKKSKFNDFGWSLIEFFSFVDDKRIDDFRNTLLKLSLLLAVATIYLRS